MRPKTVAVEGVAVELTWPRRGTASGGGGYDTHEGHLADTSVNLLHTLRRLAALRDTVP